MTGRESILSMWLNKFIRLIKEMNSNFLPFLSPHPTALLCVVCKIELERCLRQPSAQIRASTRTHTCRKTHIRRHPHLPESRSRPVGNHRSLVKTTWGWEVSRLLWLSLFLLFPSFSALVFSLSPGLWVGILGLPWQHDSPRENTIPRVLLEPFTGTMEPTLLGDTVSFRPAGQT